jgi:hypothetical protein
MRSGKIERFEYNNLVGRLSTTTTATAEIIMKTKKML